MNKVGIWLEKTQVQDSATRGLTSQKFLIFNENYWFYQ